MGKCEGCTMAEFFDKCGHLHEMQIAERNKDNAQLKLSHESVKAKKQQAESKREVCIFPEQINEAIQIADTLL